MAHRISPIVYLGHTLKPHHCHLPLQLLDLYHTSPQLQPLRITPPQLPGLSHASCQLQSCRICPAAAPGSTCLTSCSHCHCCAHALSLPCVAKTPAPPSLPSSFPSGLAYCNVGCNLGCHAHYSIKPMSSAVGANILAGMSQISSAPSPSAAQMPFLFLICSYAFFFLPCASSLICCSAFCFLPCLLWCCLSSS